jgi:tRNA (guanine-N7-)-methyltransferase
VASKNKLKRFKENEVFPNVIQPIRDTLINDDFKYKGCWGKSYFKNKNNIVLELGCGKGEYIIHLAKKYPNKNFVGIDIKGARFWRGAKTAIEQKLSNVVFIRTQIELITNVFETSEISEIWITFPDPQIKYQRTKHRLLNPNFLSKYKIILINMGLVHLKTDSEFLHGYLLGLLKNMPCHINHSNHDIYHNMNAPSDATSVQTYYEKIFLKTNKPITYLQFFWDDKK